MAIATGTSIHEQSARVGAAQQDAAWLAQLRSHAAEMAEAMPLPSSYAERPWKYYDVSRVDFASFTAVDADATEVSAPAGISVGTFASAAAVVEANLAKSVPVNRSKLTAMHYAFLSGGVVVQVPANVEGSEPVRITRNYEVADGSLATPHTLIVTGANSVVTIIEDFSSSDADILVLPVVELVPGPGSEIRYTVIHRWGENTKVFSEQRTVTSQASTVKALAVAIGGSVVKSHMEASLEGRGSASELLGLAYGYGQQHIDFYTVQDHIAADTRSDLLFKAALDDDSRSVYYGMTRVGLGAKNADANQENRNLLLSPTAKADSDPVLEILTYDIIRASHGATAGPVDQDQLFYLEARAIGHEAAQQMLVQAFLGQVLDRIPDRDLRDEIAGILGLNTDDVEV